MSFRFFGKAMTAAVKMTNISRYLYKSGCPESVITCLSTEKHLQHEWGEVKGRVISEGIGTYHERYQTGKLMLLQENQFRGGENIQLHLLVRPQHMLMHGRQKHCNMDLQKQGAHNLSSDASELRSSSPQMG